MNFPMGFAWQQVIVKKCCRPTPRHFHICLLHLAPFSYFPLLKCLFSHSCTQTQVANMHKPHYGWSKDTRGSLSALITVRRPLRCGHQEYNSCRSVHVCSLVIDAAFQLKTNRWHQSGREGSLQILKYSWVHKGKIRYLEGWKKKNYLFSASVHTSEKGRIKDKTEKWSLKGVLPHFGKCPFATWLGIKLGDWYQLISLG